MSINYSKIAKKLNESNASGMYLLVNRATGDVGNVLYSDSTMFSELPDVMAFPVGVGSYTTDEVRAKMTYRAEWDD